MEDVGGVELVPGKLVRQVGAQVRQTRRVVPGEDLHGDEITARRDRHDEPRKELEGLGSLGDLSLHAR